jgi:predicted aspartyl protease
LTKNIRILLSNHILVNAKINNIEGVFIIDTGSSNTCINLLSASKFNLVYKKSIEDASSATNFISQTFFSNKNRIQIGSILKENFEVFLFDMTHINENIVEKIDGIIGSDILKEFNAIIDYKKKLLKLDL